MEFTYRLPEALEGDITKFASLAEGYRQQRVSATEFKAFRVPMGVYEQRKNEVYMARVRATGGVISPSQLLRILDTARRHGSDLLHLTTRQEIQIQNLSLDHVEAVLRELQDAGLATKGGGGNTVRNIMVSEWSGIGSSETFDTTPYAVGLTSLMVAEPDSYLLPRKMKIAFSSDENFEDYAAINDVGLVAKIRDGRRGFKVYVGGGAGSRPSTGWLFSEFIPVENLYALVKGLKNFFSAHGNRKNRNQARIRFIFYRLGKEETLRLIRHYYEGELARASHLEDWAAETDADNPLQTATATTPENDRADTAGVNLSPAFSLWRNRYVTAQRQPGLFSVLVPVNLGNIRINEEKAVWLERLLRLTSRFGDRTLRFTNTQNIRLRNIPEGALAEIYATLTGFNEDVDRPSMVGNIVSCTGADTCRLGLALSKGLASAIKKSLLRSGLDLDRLSDVTIHVTGCPNSCGQQLWADLGFAGRVLHNERAYPGYQVYLAANRVDSPHFGEPVGNLSARDVPTFVVRLLEDYLAVPDRGKSFCQYLLEEGKAKALQLIEDYKAVPSFEDDKNYYFDWGAEEIFSVTSRGKAECSAGLFDMIDVDKDNIERNRKAIDSETDEGKKSRLVRDTIFSASRMLLVTRGLEPKTVEETFDLFLGNFIEAGYVDARFKPLVLKARNAPSGDFLQHRDDAFALAGEVIALYKGMDDSLQFKKPVNVAEKEEKSESHTVKDLRGVACPMNFVKTKLALAVMKSGELLEVWLDDGQPIENVPGSVRLEGHQVLEQTPTAEGYWKVLIKKK